MSHLKVADLSKRNLAHRLAGDGLKLRTGPFVFSIRSPFSVLSEGLHSLYDLFPVEPDTSFCDFHIEVTPPKGLRRWIRPQSTFVFDGETPFKPLAANQAFALLEWGMNWCIYNHAHHFLIIHGAVLERNGKALLLPAPSGSGKSTLCGALMSRGWRLLSDELILIDPADGKITPLGRPVSLKNRSIDVLRSFAPGHHISAPIHDTAKGSVAHMKSTPDSILRVHDHATPRWVIFPQYVENHEARLTPLGKTDVFMALIENAFNYNILMKTGFMSMTRLVDSISGFKATYGDLNHVIAHIDQLADESGG